MFSFASFISLAQNIAALAEVATQSGIGGTQDKSHITLAMELIETLTALHAAQVSLPSVSAPVPFPQVPAPTPQFIPTAPPVQNPALGG